MTGRDERFAATSGRSIPDHLPHRSSARIGLDSPAQRYDLVKKPVASSSGAAVPPSLAAKPNVAAKPTQAPGNPL
ncbi:MAG: hypothetical protein R3C05_29535 [Pirellulaceae bacterium]